jgi:hypothetical protein
VNSLDILRRPRNFWIIDFGHDMSQEEASRYEKPFAKIQWEVLPVRAKVKRKSYREYWWIHAEPVVEMRRRIERLTRFLVTPTVSKHRVFVWLTRPTLPDHQLVAFARDDDYFFGVLHSRFHEVWARAQGTQLRERESGFRYTPTTCFETFPFPEPNEEQKRAIAAAAKELNELRENWLNPPEWTLTRVLEFPGSIDRPWSRFVYDADARGIGTVRYPRLEPRDEECAKRLAKRTLTNLYNERPAWLAHAHAKLDAAVAAAYGWSDLIDILERAKGGEFYDFKTGAWRQVSCTTKQFTTLLKDLERQVDEEILSRLLALNLERAAAEKVAATAPKKRTSRARTAEEML